MTLESCINDKNWVALHIYDGFYPLTEEMSFPEALMSLEIISQLHKKRKAVKENIPRILRSMFGFDADDHHGERSSEGHYMMWVHLSDRFIAAYGIERPIIDKGLGRTLMYQNRPTDLFTAWSGETNIAGLLTEGMAGLAKPVRQEGGGLSGRFQSFEDAMKLGEADYEAGWFMSDEQAYRLLESFSLYLGTTQGYSFLRTIKERPNAPFEPDGKQLVNGYNCGDFAWFALDHAGIVPKEVSGRLKIRLWYPSSYYDHPIPLSALGQKGVRWLAKNPDAAVIPDEEMAKLAWRDLFFGHFGVEFFDKRRVVEEVAKHRPEFHAARIWEHANVIDWLKNPGNRDFESKGIVTELLPPVQEGKAITSPYRSVDECSNTRYVLSSLRAKYHEQGHEYRRRKLAKAGLHGDAYLRFRKLQDALKRDYHSTVSNKI